MRFTIKPLFSNMNFIPIHSLPIVLFLGEKLDRKELGRSGNYKNLLIHQKNIQCKPLFEESIHDEPAPKSQLKPFRYIPQPLLWDFTYGGRILVKRYFLTDSFPSDRKAGKYTTLTMLENHRKL